MSRLRVVTGEQAEPLPFPAAARAALEAALAKGAYAVCIIYEATEGVAYEAVPSIGALARGLMEEGLDVLGGAPE